MKETITNSFVQSLSFFTAYPLLFRFMIIFSSTVAAASLSSGEMPSNISSKNGSVASIIVLCSASPFSDKYIIFCRLSDPDEIEMISRAANFCAMGWHAQDFWSFYGDKSFGSLCERDEAVAEESGWRSYFLVRSGAEYSRCYCCEQSG